MDILPLPAELVVGPVLLSAEEVARYAVQARDAVFSVHDTRPCRFSTAGRRSACTAMPAPAGGGHPDRGQRPAPARQRIVCPRRWASRHRL